MAEPSALLSALHTLFVKPLKHSQQNIPEQGPCISIVFIPDCSKHHRSTINTKATLRPLHIFHVVTCNNNCPCSKWGLSCYFVRDLETICSQCNQIDLEKNLGAMIEDRNARLKMDSRFIEFFLWNYASLAGLKWGRIANRTADNYTHISNAF